MAPSFSSLPNDIAFNCLARVSIFDYPSLSLVSKGLLSLMSSPELVATRNRIRKTERQLFLCLNENRFEPDPQWFIISPFPRQKLKPLALSSHYCPQFSTVLSIGSEIFIFGGLIQDAFSKTVLVLDCRSQQWRHLRDMHRRRAAPAVDVIDGKIYVIGGADCEGMKYWGEVYDPKTETWKLLSPNTFDFTIQKSLVPKKVVLGGKIYSMDDESKDLFLEGDACLVEVVDKSFCFVGVCFRNLIWRKIKDDRIEWEDVMGLEGVFPDDLQLVSNSIGGSTKQATVMWKSEVEMCPGRSCINACKQEIWCAEVSFEMRVGQLWGLVEWRKLIHTFHSCTCSYLCSAVTG